ncbi:MAG: hypothetical protein CM15mP58_20430 [Burkholderiaceae bacterium]|nr:MAG: hypothetical protein CM15mP58_20430 [Burkholderiaceae bacterium]
MITVPSFKPNFENTARFIHIVLYKKHPVIKINAQFIQKEFSSIRLYRYDHFSAFPEVTPCAVPMTPSLVPPHSLSAVFFKFQTRFFLPSDQTNFSTNFPFSLSAEKLPSTLTLNLLTTSLFRFKTIPQPSTFPLKKIQD